MVKSSYQKKVRRCAHLHLTLLSELDRYWVACDDCFKEGPQKRSVMLALIGWAIALPSRDC